MNDLKQRLINAGFTCEKREHWGDNWDLFLAIKRENEAHYLIGVNISEKEYCVQRIQTTIITKAFEDLNHLSKLVFAFTHKDLNFEAKKYTWEECVVNNGYFINSFSEVVHQQTLNGSIREHNIVPTELNALSIDATTQLMQICARINEDFEQTKEDKDYYPVLLDDEIILKWSNYACNQFRMNSQLAGKELLRTNTPLLLQYFEKQAK